MWMHASRWGWNVSGTVGARDGIRTRDPNLTKIVRYPCATRAYLFISFPRTPLDTKLALGHNGAASCCARHWVTGPCIR